MARHADSTPMTLSAGERQRMLLAKGFLVRTPVFFLDEPTVGLDPEGGREVREWVRSQLVGSEGTSAILTTHRMGEAEELCARIAIMDRGRIVACDTPLELKRLAGERSVLEVRAPAVPQAAVEEVRRLPEVRTAAAAPAGEDGMEESLRVLCEDPERAAGRVVDTLRRHGVVPASVDTLEPTLEDAFIALTDRRLES